MLDAFGHVATGKSSMVDADHEPVNGVLVEVKRKITDWALCPLHDELLSQTDVDIKYNVYVGLVVQLRADHPPTVDAVRGNFVHKYRGGDVEKAYNLYSGIISLTVDLSS